MRTDNDVLPINSNADKVQCKQFSHESNKTMTSMTSMRVTAMNNLLTTSDVYDTLNPSRLIVPSEKKRTNTVSLVLRIPVGKFEFHGPSNAAIRGDWVVGPSKRKIPS